MIWRKLLIATLALLLPGGPLDAAQMPDAPSASQEHEQKLFVELIVNGKSTETIVPLQIDGNTMLVEGKLLRQAGIQSVGDGMIDVASLHGVRADYDAGIQTLTLDVAPEMLPLQRVRSGDRIRQPTVADYGAMLNYDAFLQRSGGSTTTALWTEQRFFRSVRLPDQQRHPPPFVGHPQ